MTNDEVAEAYRRYGSMVLRRCTRALGSRAAAQDVLQEVLIKLWRYGQNFAAAESKIAWLFRIADRCCCDYLAKLRGGSEAGLFLAEWEPRGCSSGVVEDREAVMRFLGPLDDRMRELVVLHYLAGMTQEEVAQATGWSRQTVFKKLAFVRDRARVLREAFYLATRYSV